MRDSERQRRVRVSSTTTFGEVGIVMPFFEAIEMLNKGILSLRRGRVEKWFACRQNVSLNFSGAFPALAKPVRDQTVADNAFEKALL